MKFTVPVLAFLILPVAALAATPAQIAAGETIVFSTSRGNCLACHVIAGGSQPGDVGPELKNVESMVPDRKELYAIIYDEEARNPQTIMPPFGKNDILTPQQINEVIDFLYTK